MRIPLYRFDAKNWVDTIENDEFGLMYYDCLLNTQRINKVEYLIGFHELFLTELAIKKIFGYHISN
jgi:hypothetical protein